MSVRDLKKAIEVEDQAWLEQKGDEDSCGSGEDVERAGKSRKLGQERIKRLKKTFRPRWYGISSITRKTESKEKITK